MSGRTQSGLIRFSLDSLKGHKILLLEIGDLSQPYFLLELLQSSANVPCLGLSEMKRAISPASCNNAQGRWHVLFQLGLNKERWWSSAVVQGKKYG